MTVRTPPPPGQRRLATVIAIATNAAFGLYLIAVAPQTLTGSPVWRGALNLLGPAVEDRPGLLAAPLWLSAVLMALGMAARLHVLLLAGCVVGFGAWGLLAGSWGHAAATLSGLGAGSVVMAVCCVIPTHAAVLMPREERRDTAQEA